MLKLFLTGDNHIGKKYDRYPEVRERLIESRFESLRGMVRLAENEGCELFVLAGDLFDNISGIKVSDVKRVVEILTEFHGTVLVLPGNHDYYTGEEKVWADFEKALSEREHNLILLKEYRPYSFEAGEQRVTVYPALCQSKHSRENNLDWMKRAELKKDSVNLGLAHGAIAGVTPDLNEEYFLMTEAELSSIPMDAWLIGHTHIPYPALGTEDEEGHRIFNAGTHEQTDLHNHTRGYGFVITIFEDKTVKAHSALSGRVFYHDLKLSVSPERADALEAALQEAVSDLEENAVVRVRVSGSVKQEEYDRKEMLYQDALSRFLTYEYEDSELTAEITRERIRDEFPEISLAAKFMEGLMDDPVELRMAYQLLAECRE